MASARLVGIGLLLALCACAGAPAPAPTPSPAPAPAPPASASVEPPGTAAAGQPVAIRALSREPPRRPIETREHEMAEPLDDDPRPRALSEPSLAESAKNRESFASRAELELWADELRATNELVEKLVHRPVGRNYTSGWHCFSVIDKNRRPPVVSSACFRTVELCEVWREASEGARRETVPCMKKKLAFCTRVRDALEKRDFNACAETPLICDHYTKYYLVKSQRYAILRGCEEAR